MLVIGQMGFTLTMFGKRYTGSFREINKRMVRLLGLVIMFLVFAGYSVRPLAQEVSPLNVSGVKVGEGYTDVSPKHLVRTAANVLYAVLANCESYPCEDVAQTIRVYKGNQAGIPTSFERMDQTHEPSAVAGLAAAIDARDRIHVLWTARSAQNNVRYLRYALFDTPTGRWGSTTTIASNLDFDDIGQGDQMVAIALDANGNPHAAYLAGALPNRRVYYRHKVGSTWSAAVQLDDGVVYSNNQKAWHPNLAFDPAGRILTVWLRGSFNGDHDGVVFTRSRSPNGTWGSAVSVSGSARVHIDQSTSVMITADNRYHLTFISAPDDYVRYVYSDDQGLTWQFNNPGGGVQVTHNPSLGPAPEGRIRIYGHGTPVPSPDGHGDNLYYFEGEGGSAAWSAFTPIVMGSYDSSVNTRWSQFFHAHTNYLDFAYWSDQYPNIAFVGIQVWGTPDNAAPLRSRTNDSTPELSRGAIHWAKAYETQVDTDTLFTAAYTYQNHSIPLDRLW